MGLPKRKPGVILRSDWRDNNRYTNTARLLRDGPRSMRSIADETHAQFEAIRSVVRRLVRDGIAEEIGFDGETGHKLFALTEAGREWLDLKLA